MRSRTLSKQRGMTFLEIMISVGIVALISAFSWKTYSDFIKSKALTTSAGIVASVLAEARSMSASSRADTNYGVYLEAKQITRFSGSTFATGTATNVVTKLSPYASISAMSLSPGGPSIVFDRLRGGADKSGTITISLTSSTSTARVLTIYQTGLVE